MTVRITIFLIATRSSRWRAGARPELDHLHRPDVDATSRSRTSTTDPDEKDFGLADLDNDGDLDLVNVRKEGFYADGPRDAHADHEHRRDHDRSDRDLRARVHREPVARARRPHRRLRQRRLEGRHRRQHELPDHRHELSRPSTTRTWASSGGDWLGLAAPGRPHSGRTTPGSAVLLRRRSAIRTATATSTSSSATTTTTSRTGSSSTTAPGSSPTRTSTWFPTGQQLFDLLGRVERSPTRTATATRTSSSRTAPSAS